MDRKRALARGIVERLQKAGYEAYFAGGCVRDMLLGLTPQDYDVATAARPEEVQALFERTEPVGAQFGVVLVLVDDTSFEVATFRTEGPTLDGRRPSSVAFADAKQDVFRRDFTINGMLYDPVADRVLDWVGGRADLERRIIRAIGNPEQRFQEDRLRMMRAIRFATRFSCSIEEATYEGIRAEAPHITDVSRERIRDELLAILIGPEAGRGLRLLHATGLLAAFLPEAEALAGVEQPPRFHPEGDVFEHTCIMLDLAESPSPELALAILLHDVGKPPTQSFAERIRFDEHDAVGAEMAADICRRLRCPNVQVERVRELVAGHMRFARLEEMKESKLRRLLADPLFDEHLELHRLDCLASHGKLDVWTYARGQKQAFADEKPVPPPLLTGHDLIAMGLAPGPHFKRILDDVQDRQLERELNSREEALEYVRRHYGEGEADAE